MKKWAIGMLAVVVASTFAACSNSNGGNETSAEGEGTSEQPAEQSGKSEPAPAAEPEEEASIIFSTISGYYTTALKEAAEQYGKEHPGKTVTIEVINDNGAYKTNFDSKMAAGGKDAPDIVHANLVGNDQGWLMKLNEFVNEPNPYNGGKTVFDGIDPGYHGYAYDANGDVTNLPFDLVGTGFFYNKDIFEKLNLEVPQTWEALLAAAETIEKAGYIALAMPNSAEAWMHSSFIDWTTRHLHPELLILPGDGRYDEKIHKKNTEIKYDPNNPHFDFGSVHDMEKIILATKNGMYDPEGPAEQKWWTVLKQLSSYYQPGYATMDEQTIYPLFLSQKAAMFWNGSWQVGTLIADQQELGDKSFQWGTFKFPEFETPDPLFQGKPRGILVPGHMLAIAQKDDAAKQALAKDFMKYLYSKDVAQRIFERTLEVGEFVQGPSLVIGVDLPDEINAYLEGFRVEGLRSTAMDWNSIGRIADQEAAWQQNRLDFYDGKITLEEFLKKKSDFVDANFEKVIKDNGYDLDPKTNP